MRPWDVIIVGGGPAGVAAALELNRRNHRVLLVERTGYESWRPGETFPPEGQGLLTVLGLWQPFRLEGPRPSHATLSAWGDARLMGPRPLDGFSGSGWHVNRQSFDAMLARTAEESGVTVLRNTRASVIGRESDCFSLQLDAQRQQSTEQAHCVVDATGRAASIASALGGRRVLYDRLVGIVGMLEGTLHIEQSVLLIEAMSDGWWYSVPLPDGRLLCAFMTDGDLLSDSQASTADFWASRLEQSLHTRQRARGRAPRGGVRVRNAATGCLTPAAGPGWMAIGDAASSHDPLSARGICHALASGIEAAKAVSAYLGGKTAGLEQYALQSTQRFGQYLVERRQYYRMETRWPDSLFWRRRRGMEPEEQPILLNPAALLESSGPVLSKNASSGVEAFLPVSVIERLWRTCLHPIAAHQVVAHHQGAPPTGNSAHLLIVALQKLLDGGALRLVEAAGTSQ